MVKRRIRLICLIAILGGIVWITLPKETEARVIWGGGIIITPDGGDWFYPGWYDNWGYEPYPRVIAPLPPVYYIPRRPHHPKGPPPHFPRVPHKKGPPPDFHGKPPHRGWPRHP